MTTEVVTLPCLRQINHLTTCTQTRKWWFCWGFLKRFLKLGIFSITIITRKTFENHILNIMDFLRHQVFNISWPSKDPHSRFWDWRDLWMTLFKYSFSIFCVTGAHIPYHWKTSNKNKTTTTNKQTKIVKNETSRLCDFNNNPSLKKKIRL